MVVDDISLTTCPTVPVLAEVFDTSIVPWRSSVLAAEDNPPFQTGIIEWQADSMRLKITQGDFVLGEDTTWLGAAAREIQVQNNTQYRIGLDVLNNLNSLDVPIELNNIVTASINIYDADAFAQTGLLGTEPIAVIPITQYGTIQSGTFRSRQSNIIVLAHMRSGKTQQVAPGVFYIDNLKLELVEKSTTYTCDGSTPNTQIGGSYRFGFNGMEKEPEVSTGGYSAEFWMYESRLGRRWNVEPLSLNYPYLSSYCSFNNNPIIYTDVNGASFGLPHWLETIFSWLGYNKRDLMAQEDPEDVEQFQFQQARRYAGTTALKDGSEKVVQGLDNSVGMVMPGFSAVVQGAHGNYKTAIGLLTFDVVGGELVGNAFKGIFKLCGPIAKTLGKEFSELSEKYSIKTLKILDKGSDKFAVIGQVTDRVKAATSFFEKSGAKIERFHPTEDAVQAWTKIKADWAGKGAVPDDIVKGTDLYKQNLDWVSTIKSKGYSIIDIGSYGESKSTFYEMEKSQLYGKAK